MSENDQKVDDTSLPPDGTSLPPIIMRSEAEVMEEWVANYPDLQYYPAIAQKDIHLAGLYRQAVTGDIEHLNPVQAVVENDIVWIEVLAEIESETKIEQLKEFMEIRVETGQFLTGRVKAEDLPRLVKLVRRLKAARPIAPTVYRSVPAIEADAATLARNWPPGDGLPLFDGRDVIVGIVDVEGGDFKHANFRNPDGTSRLLFLWDQSSEKDLAMYAAPYDCGREFTQAMLNDALQTADPYAALQYTPKDKAHGTHVMDIAAGSSSQHPGVATQAELIFVHLGLPTPITVEQGTLGSSSYLMNAVKYIFDKADALQKPAVINLSLGANGGPHDGSTLAEEMFDSLLNEKPGRAIVVAAGNSYNSHIHSSSQVANPFTLQWFIESHAPSGWWQRQELEIWYEAADVFNVEIETPDGTLLGGCALDQTQYGFAQNSDTELLLISHRSAATLGENENHINIFVDDRYPALTPLGDWRFRLTRTPNSTGSGNFHAWIERNDEYASHFAPASSQNQYTLNGIGNADLPIVVGSYDATNSGSFSISWFSGAGPSRNSRQPNKPDVSAPGENIYAARATCTGGTVKSGTSMAAPHVTGVVALLFQAAQWKHQRILSVEEVRQILFKALDRVPPAGNVGVHDIRYGFGRINARRALAQILDDN